MRDKFLVILKKMVKWKSKIDTDDLVILASLAINEINSRGVIKMQLNFVPKPKINKDGEK